MGQVLMETEGQKMGRKPSWETGGPRWGQGTKSGQWRWEPVMDKQDMGVMRQRMWDSERDGGKGTERHGPVPSSKSRKESLDSVSFLWIVRMALFFT